MRKLALAFVCLTASLFAATIDGKWTAELKKGEMTLNLKSDGDKLNGTVKARKREVAIQDGKLAGEKFSFTTMQKAKNGEVKMIWSGSVKGDELTGTRGKEGGKRIAPFQAKRAS